MPIYWRKEQVHAIQMQMKFILETENQTMYGNVGDYLVTSKDRQYIMNKEDFEREFNQDIWSEEDLKSGYEAGYTLETEENW